MIQPNFFIVGAPKCGTTSLARWLAEHPEIFVSTPKEPHYFSTDLKNRQITQADRYTALFGNASPTVKMIGEASTWYLYSHHAVPRIEQELPGARYLIMVRDLPRMAYSLYVHNHRRLHENADDFQTAWELQAPRLAGRHIPRSCTEPAFLQYKAACSLGSQLQRFAELVPQHRWHCTRLEDMAQNPRGEYLRILEFLGLPDDGRIDFPLANPARRLRWRWLEPVLRHATRWKHRLGWRRPLGIRRANENLKNVEPMTELTRKFLEQQFHSEQQLLDQILQARETFPDHSAQTAKP